MSAAPSYRVVGHLNKPHGTKGEFFVWSLTDHPGSSFAPGVIMFVADATGNTPDSAEPSLSVESARPFRRGFLVKFRGGEDRDRAGGLQGKYLLRPAEELDGLEEGEVFYHQLLGLKVVTVDGDDVGEIVEVYELRPADLLEVRGADRTHHIPFLATVVQNVDLEKGIMTIAPPEGLLDL